MIGIEEHGEVGWRDLDAAERREGRSLLFMHELSVNDAISSYVRQAAAAARRLGLPTVLGNYRHPESFERILKLVGAGRISHWISVANVGGITKLSALAQKNRPDLRDKPPVAFQTMAQQTGTEYVFIDYEHPSCFFGDAIYFGPGTYYLNPSRAHARLMGDAFPHFRLGALAHADDPQPDSPWSQRDIDVLFLGNVPTTLEETAARWRDEQPAVAALLHRARPFADAAAEGDGGGPHAVLSRAVGSSLWGAAEVVAMAELDKYIRLKSRIAAVRAMAGVRLTICGSGWDGIADAAHEVRPPVLSDEAKSLISRAKICLNLNAAYYRSHERVYQAMSRGAAVVSMGRDFLAAAGDAATPDPVAYAPISALADTIHDLLADPAALEARAALGRARQRAAHTWEHRVADLARQIGVAHLMTREPDVFA